MRVLSALVLSTAAIGAAAYSQHSGDGPPRGGRHHDPLMQLFDANQDGHVSAAEMDDASSILAALDTDGDGVANENELPGPPRPRHRGCKEHGRPEPPPQRDTHPDLESIERELSAPTGEVVIIGGHDTDPRDQGRPVALIAAALGVEDQVFRDAFSGVSPARGGDPTAARAHANKQVLMDALGPHGVTNERLDEVSNFYRYQPQAGGLWRHTPAQATAVIENGKVVAIKLTNPGAGYTVPPEVIVAGYDVQVQAKLEFGADLQKNGQISTLTIVE